MPIPRRILIRVIGAPLLVAALCGIIYWGHTLEREGKRNSPVEILLLIVAVLCWIEYVGMVKAKGIETDLKSGLVAMAAVFMPWHLMGLGFRWESQIVAVVTTAFPIYLLFKLVFCYGKFTPEAAGLTYLGFGYLSLLRYASHPGIPGPLAWFLLFLLAAGKGSDMAAFVAGKSIGKHKMSPVVSPNKTWEGGIAGGVVGTIAGFCVLWFSPLRLAYGGVPAAALLLFALVITIAAQVGDLIKSAFKRWAGVKDSGRLLPEFGGMIDMVDSFIIAAPMAALGHLLLEWSFKGR